ncbi:MAG: hypothetical protein AB1762_17105 [Gemmatimonadota bacterium]
MPGLRALFLAAVTLPLLALDADAQRKPEHERVVRARAQRAQLQFESYRRRQLPVAHGRTGSSDCDVRLGRFCYWHDDAEDLPSEPEPIGKARDSFVRTLDSLARDNPADPWIAGQRVRYRVEAKRPQDALHAALGCSDAGWWCAALSGFAKHALGDYSGADSAFAAALEHMPGAQRCEWTDLRHILPDDYQGKYRRIPCDRRDSINAHIWWLADPRWGGAGNDLRTELYARLTMAEMVRQSRSTHNMAWGDDMAELMLRYGWPTAWSRGWPSASDPTQISVVGHEPSPSFEFMPSGRTLEEPLAPRLDGWTPLAERPVTRYAPAYANHFRELQPQIAWFARGDSAVVVVGYDVRIPADTVFTRDSVEAAAVLSLGPGDAAIARGLDGKRHGALVLATRRDSAIVSVEVLDSNAKALARARVGVRPPSDTNISDLLLFEGTGDLPRTFEDATARALGTLTVLRSEPFGVYWELYGDIAQADSVTYSVSVERRSTSLLRRFAERVRLAQPVLPVRMSFDAGRAAASRALVVDVGHIPPGRYTLTLRVATSGESATTQREIEVR